MVANAGRLVEWREARASHNWGNPVAQPQSRAEPSELRQRACPLTAARAEGNFAVVNRSELDHGEARNSLEIAEVQRREFVAEMQRCRTNQQILKRKLDAHRFLLAFDAPG